MPFDVTLTEEQTAALDHYLAAFPNHTTNACPYPMRAMCGHKRVMDQMTLDGVFEAKSIVAADGRILRYPTDG